MHKFTTSTAEEREAHRAEVKDILMSMHETEVTVTSTAHRGFGFRIKGTFQVSDGDYSVVTADLESCIDFNLQDVEAAWATSTGNIIRIDTHS